MEDKIILTGNLLFTLHNLVFLVADLFLFDEVIANACIQIHEKH